MSLASGDADASMPLERIVSWRQLEEIEGHRTVMTMESSSACQEWSIPGPQTA
jgi:hypothetical protein